MNKKQLLKFIESVDDDYEIICEDNSNRILGLEEESCKYSIDNDAIVIDPNRKIIYLEIKSR